MSTGYGRVRQEKLNDARHHLFQALWNIAWGILMLVLFHDNVFIDGLFVGYFLGAAVTRLVMVLILYLVWKREE